MSLRLSAGSPLRLLRRHVGRRAEDHAHAGHHRGRRDRRRCRRRRRGRAWRRVASFARPKSSTFTMPSGAHLDVRGLQIAMDDPLLVRRFERLGDLLRDRQRLVDRDRAARDALRQSSPSTSSITSAVHAAALFEAVDARDVRDDSATRASCASRWKRASRSASCANASGRILIATSRSSFVSRAR